MASYLKKKIPNKQKPQTLKEPNQNPETSPHFPTWCKIFLWLKAGKAAYTSEEFVNHLTPTSPMGDFNTITLEFPIISAPHSTPHPR